MKIYDLIKRMLEINPSLRDSDKRLIFEIWKYEGLTEYTKPTGEISITFGNFMKATTPETITRARRQVQESNPHLQAKERVKQARSERAKKGHQIVFGQSIDGKFK